MTHTVFRLRSPLKSIRRAWEQKENKRRRRQWRLVMESLETRQLMTAAWDELPLGDGPELQGATAADYAWGSTCLPLQATPARIAEHQARLERLLQAALAPDAEQYVLLEGDFNGDGLTDLLFVHQDADGTTLILDLRLANADGTWTSHRHEIQGVEGVDLELLLVDDIDGDGRDDLIFAMRDPQNGGELRLYVVRSLGDGQWSDVQPVSEDDYVLETVDSVSDWDAAIEEIAFAHDAATGASDLVTIVPVYVENETDSDPDGNAIYVQTHTTASAHGGSVERTAELTRGCNNSYAFLWSSTASWRGSIAVAGGQRSPRQRYFRGVLDDRPTATK